MIYPERLVTRGWHGTNSRIDELGARRDSRTSKGIWPLLVIHFVVVCLVVVCILFASGPVLGDQVEVAQQRYPRAKIVGMDKGQLQFRTSSYELASVALTDVARLFVDSTAGMEDFNEAEDFVSQGEPAKAIVRYERTIRSVKGFWADLTSVRLLRACDLAGRLNKAVTNFLRVIEGATTGPVVAARMIPSQIPYEGSDDVQRAVSQLDRAAGASLSASGHALVMLLRYDVLSRVGNGRSAAMVPVIARLVIPPSIATPRACAIQLTALKVLFSHQVTPDYFKWLDRAIAGAAESVVPDLLLLKGQTLLRQASTRDEVIRAGWAFMRVVIHFAQDGRAAQGLIGTAEVYRRLGRVNKARQLLQESLAHPKITAAARKRATDALERL